MTTHPLPSAIDTSARDTVLPAEQREAPAANASRFTELPAADSSEPSELQTLVRRGYN